jgi:uncharacterized protein (TIGR02246 family)
MTTEAASTRNERAIRDLIDVLVTAIRAKDLRKTMSVYAPDLVAFDVVPPLQTSSAAAFERQWQGVFSYFQGEIDYEIRDLHITTGDDVAFSHSLNRLTTVKDGRETGVWVRWTACYRKIDGKWLIAHMQASVPVDLAGGGKALLDLQP